MKMKPMISTMLFLTTGLVRAASDNLEEIIKIGTPVEALVPLFGKEPNSSECHTTLGVSFCLYVWELGNGLVGISKKYTIKTVAGRAVSISVSTKKSLF